MITNKKGVIVGTSVLTGGFVLLVIFLLISVFGLSFLLLTPILKWSAVVIGLVILFKIIRGKD